MKKKVLLLTTGGTIASNLSPTMGYSPVESSRDEFLSFCEDLLDDVELSVCAFSNVLSFSLTPAMILDLVSLLRKKVDKEQFDGVIVTQGTAMLEETPYLTDLFWTRDTPVVFTGAMLNHSEPDWDGARNIRNSLITVLSPEASGKGVLVCLGGEIHAARDVIKFHKTALAPLLSPNTGPLGLVASSKRAVFYRSPTRRIAFEKLEVEPRVEIAKVGLGSSGVVIDALAAAGCPAIVLESLPGGGGVSPEVFAAIRRAHKKTIFVHAPRSVGGSAISSAGGGCGPVDMQKLGVLCAGDMSAVKARIFLIAALPQVTAPKDLADILEKVCY